MATIYWGAHGATGKGSPSVIFIGDSWLWYPIGNLPMSIGQSFPNSMFVVAGRNGSEAADWAVKQRKEIDFTFKMFADGAQALVLSGGGNDIAGMADLLRILADNCSKATKVSECYRVAQPDEILSAIVAGYRGVILKFRARNTQATVFTHNYDHAWPTGQGLFGPAKWLKEPMDRAKVPKELRRDLLKDLLAKLLRAQRDLGKEAGIGPFVAINSAGTLPEEGDDGKPWWANELHPTPAGFNLLATRAFTAPLKKVVTF
jgi:hypothetical protein